MENVQPTHEIPNEAEVKSPRAQNRYFGTTGEGISGADPLKLDLPSWPSFAALPSFCALVIFVFSSLFPPLVFLFSSASCHFFCILLLASVSPLLSPVLFPPSSACFLLCLYYFFLLSLPLPPMRGSGQSVAGAPSARGHCELGSRGTCPNSPLGSTSCYPKTAGCGLP